VLLLFGAILFLPLLDPTSTVPFDTGIAEPTCSIYSNPQPIEIAGYDGDCMEPFVTGDGKYLLFNNSNASFVDTHIHLLRRVGDGSFQHLGLLPGAISKSKDMAPTIDAAGNLYFTCLESYEKDGISIYAGRFAGEKLTGMARAKGDISPHKPGEINMDCGVSKDGNTMILSRAHFSNYFLPPDRSDLVAATKNGGAFEIEKEDRLGLAQQNTPVLEYAPCLSADQLELYYTRASRLAKTDPRCIEKFGKATGKDVFFRIMLARRNAVGEPFGKPMALSTIEGFVEAPTVTDDKQQMFFHKKVGDKFRIFRALRNAKD